MTKERVFVTRRIPQVGLERLEAAGLDVDLWTDPLPPPREELQRRAAGCAGVLTLLSDPVDAEFFEAVGEPLRVVSNFAVGVNNIDLQAARQRGVAVGNTPGVLTDATADMALTLMLAAARRLVEAVEDARGGRWKTWEPIGWIGNDLVGATLGIVGMGRIGQAVARRCHFGWQMPVLYTARSAKPEVEREMGARRVEFEQLLSECDFVSIHTDLNPQTEKLFNRASFARMRPGSILVNTARGGVVDQEALFEALQVGPLGAAGLDVTDPEPLPSESPLWSLPNCIIAPHIASATRRTRDAMARIAAENLIAGVEGRPLVASAL